MAASAPFPSRPSAVPAKARRVLPIEEALRWMARDELPKSRQDMPIKAPPTQSVHPMWRNGIFGARIDNWNRDPGMPAAMGDPHPDALRMEQAIRKLDVSSLDLSGYRIAHGLTRLDPRLPLAAIIDQALGHAIGWLFTCAVRGGVPDHGCGPIFEPHKGANGKPILWIAARKEIGQGADGEIWYADTHVTTKKCYGGDYRPEKGPKYRTGTFCKLRFTREARDVALDRAIYAAWHAAACELRTVLSKTEIETVIENGAPVARRVPILKSLDLRPPAAPAEPWIEPPPARAVVLSLVPPPEEVVTTREKRERLPPRNPASPVRHLDPASYPLAA